MLAVIGRINNFCSVCHLVYILLLVLMNRE